MMAEYRTVNCLALLSEIMSPRQDHQAAMAPMQPDRSAGSDNEDWRSEESESSDESL